MRPRLFAVCLLLLILLSDLSVPAQPAAAQADPARGQPEQIVLTPNANPRRVANQREIKLACGTAQVPGPTKPNSKKTT